MTDAEHYRAQAALSFEIADCLSDKEAAERVRESARKTIRLAERLEAAEARLER